MQADDPQNFLNIIIRGVANPALPRDATAGLDQQAQQYNERRSPMATTPITNQNRLFASVEEPIVGAAHERGSNISSQP